MQCSFTISINSIITRFNEGHSIIRSYFITGFLHEIRVEVKMLMYIICTIGRIFHDNLEMNYLIYSSVEYNMFLPLESLNFCLSHDLTD